MGYAVLCLVLWYIFFNGFPLFGYPTMLLCNHETTEMKVEQIENPGSLPILFSDSIRSDQSFVYYQFDFNAQKPLKLMEMTIYNEKESKAFQKFMQKNNRVRIDEEEGGSAWLSGRGSIILRDALQHQSVLKKELLIAKLITNEKIYVKYKFTQGNITVRYRFIDTQTNYGRMDYFAK